MIQYMTPIDFWRTGMALWSRTAELQIEMMRLSLGMADGLTNSGKNVMHPKHPTGMSSSIQTRDVETTGKKAVSAPKSRTLARKTPRPVPKAVKLAVVSDDPVKDVAKPTPRTPRRKAAEPAKISAPVEVMEPVSKASRRRAPAIPKTPEAILEPIAPIADAPAKPTRARRKAAPKADTLPAKAEESPKKPTAKSAAVPKTATKGTAAKKAPARRRNTAAAKKGVE